MLELVGVTESVKVEWVAEVTGSVVVGSGVATESVAVEWVDMTESVVAVTGSAMVESGMLTELVIVKSLSVKVLVTQSVIVKLGVAPEVAMLKLAGLTHLPMLA